MTELPVSPSATSRDVPSALRLLSRQYPGIDDAASRSARLSAELTLPKGTVHVISDVHGEFAKLRHVINNASGTLRPLVEQIFGSQLSADELQQFLALVFYPREMLAQVEARLTSHEERRQYCQQTLSRLFDITRVLAKRYTLQRANALFPDEYRELLRELLFAPSQQRGASYRQEIVDSLIRHGRAFYVIRLVVRVLRNLAIDELIIAGDCWDRGPRGDRVVDYISHLPNVSFIWGNHDASWLGACLGNEALIANVLRISLRYRRLSQLEEGYGITLQPLEKLVRDVYRDDPASYYKFKGEGLRPDETMRRMQKAVAIMQFKLEGQIIERNPQFGLDHRRLLHKIDASRSTIEIDGQRYPLSDTRFPTLDPANPYKLSVDEQHCMARIRESFLASAKLWDQMRFLISRGAMYLCRDENLIFHGCVPVDQRGEFQELAIDGRARRGRDLFDALDEVIPRVAEHPTQPDLDLLWYLWCGPLSPLFGKDRVTTLENDLVADPATHVETKNAYFQLIHEVPFCERVLAEFGIDPDRGLIVNGHVPVKIEKGESPLKRSGKAITIDGAFSQAYGDHGYTLVIEPEQTFLALHHHFESVTAAIRDGVDIVPAITTIRRQAEPRRVQDTERGAEIRAEIELLEQLIAAYRENRLRTAL